MYRLPQISRLAAIVLLSAATVFAADEVSIRVDENTLPGHSLTDLHELLDVDPSASIQLDSTEQGFSIDESGRLIIKEGVELDYEAQSDYEIPLTITVPHGNDVLRDRFADSARDAGVDEESLVPLYRTTRQSVLRLLVDDVPEPPQLLERVFLAPLRPSANTSQVAGAFVAADPDRSETLRFELVSGGDVYWVDAVTGVISVRDDVNLPLVSRMQVRVRVTDSAGLSDVRTYELPLMAIPPAPSPVSVAGETPIATTDKGGPVVSLPPLQPEVSLPPEPTENGTVDVAPPSTSKSDTPGEDVAAAGAVAKSIESPPAPSSRVNWLLGIMAAIVGVAVATYLVRRGRIGSDEFDGVMGEPKGPTAADNHSDLMPDEIENLLSRLDDEIKTSAPSRSKLPVSDDGGLAAVNDLMSQALASGGFSPKSNVLTDSSVALSRTEEGGESAVVSPSRRHSDMMTNEERERFEEFRQISRQTNHDQISRHHREKMREEWTSVGLTALACLLIGIVCIFTRCFGEISVSIGTVLMSVSATLLMRRSLYPRVPRRRAGDGSVLPESHSLMSNDA